MSRLSHPKLLWSFAVGTLATTLSLGACSTGSSDDPVPTTRPVLTTTNLTTTTTEVQVVRQFYVIQPGDTLNGIAVSFGVTLEALMAENALSDFTIQPGSQLIIPPPVASEETNTSEGS
jgi:LysM repeat protein